MKTKIKKVWDGIKTFSLIVVIFTIGATSIMSYNGYVGVKKQLENPQEIRLIENTIPVLEEESVILEGYEISEEKTVKMTAYNTVEEQTDSTPCISASNKDICGRNDVIAMNGYKFGTKVMIDDKIYTVEDRKASRYDSSWIDISFDKDLQGAIGFGKQEKNVIIYKKI